MGRRAFVTSAYRLGVIVLLAPLTVSVAAGAVAPPPGPPGLQRAGRWFTYNGRYVYLAGIDAQHLVADPSNDVAAVLDRLRAHRINKVRIWIDAYWDNAFSRPWATDPRTGRLDLDAWNDGYWSRLHDFAAAAQAREIIVEVSIFHIKPGDTPRWSPASWKQAWNKEYNVNAVFSANASGHFYPQFYDLNHPERSATGKTLYDYQKALVDKIITAFDPFHNVYYEIHNEFGDGGNQDDIHQWQEYWAQYVKQHSRKIVGVHAGDDVGPTHGEHYYWDQSYVDGIDYHLGDDQRYPDRTAADLRRAQMKNKILQCNESYPWYSGTSVDMGMLDQETRGLWAWFVLGGYFAIYDGHLTQYAGWDLMANRLNVLHDVVDTVPWWTMSPVDPSGNGYDSLVSQGPATRWQILANPGAAYVVYYWDDGSQAPSQAVAHLQLPRGAYRYGWYDPTTGDVMASGAVEGGGTASIAAPPPSWNRNVGVVLILQK